MAMAIYTLIRYDMTKIVIVNLRQWYPLAPHGDGMDGAHLRVKVGGTSVYYLSSWSYIESKCIDHAFVLGSSNSLPSGAALLPNPPSLACTGRPLNHVAFATPLRTLPW
jgi:hypothetical protein